MCRGALSYIRDAHAHGAKRDVLHAKRDVLHGKHDVLHGKRDVLHGKRDAHHAGDDGKLYVPQELVGLYK